MFATFAGATEYSGKLKITGEFCTEGYRNKVIRKASETACRCVHRSLWLIQNRFEAIKERYRYGANFAVLTKDKAYYERALSKRYKACTQGEIKYHCVGRCGTQNEREAYIMSTFGIAHSTINLCDEFFETKDIRHLHLINHEFGRLEGIGDSPDFDTDNIYVWDAITENLCDEQNFRDLKSLGPKQ